VLNINPFIYIRAVYSDYNTIKLVFVAFLTK
jgi:hypothetical protein